MSASRLPSPGHALSPLAKACLLLGSLTVFRAVFSGWFELAGDEAYYWLWSRHPAVCYYSKGPGVALAIRAGTALLGDVERGVRLAAVLLSFFSGLGLFALARRLFDDHAALQTIVLGAVIPLFSVGSLLMTIDPLSVFFWIAAALSFLRAADRDRVLDWTVTGLLLGAGMLCKYTNAVEWLCLALFAVWMPRHRRMFRRPGFYLMTVAGLLCLVPVLVWNARNGWVTFHHIVNRGALDAPPQFKPGEFFEFLGSQAGVLSPLLFIGVAIALAHRPWRSGPKAEAFRFLAVMIVPLFVGYALVSFNGEWEANWTAPALALCPVLLAGWWGPRLDGGRVALRRWAVAAVGLAAALTVVLHAGLLTPLPYGKDPFRRLRGARDLAGRVNTLAEEHQATFVIGKSYGLASHLAFYLPNHPTTYIPGHDGIKNQFSFWPGYRDERRPGETALYVTTSDDPNDQLLADFARVEPVADFFTEFKGRPLRHYQVFLCADLQPPPAAAQP